MEFLNGSKQDIQTVFPDNFHYFELLAGLVEREPSEVFEPLERAQMQAIGIEKGKPFAPDEKTKALLSEAARIGGAIARAVTFDSRNPGVFYYPDRKWQAVPEGMTYTFMQDGTPQIDARNNVYYMAAGNSPAMMAKNVGQGSQYLWTYRDAEGAFLDGAKTYRLHVPADIPVEAFWSVVVYDVLSRSELQTSQPLPVGQRLQRSEDQRRRHGRHLLRAGEAAGRGKLDRDGAGQGLVPDLPLLQPGGGLLRQELAARGHRACRVIGRPQVAQC